MLTKSDRAAVVKDLRDYWSRHAKRKARTCPDVVVAETLVTTGLGVLDRLLGKREMARRLREMADKVSRAADAEEATWSPSTTTLN